MRFLRTVSTRRLLAGLAGLLIVAVGGTAISVAAAGNGPVPKKRSLAAALHQALRAKSVKGLSASITFTNNLIGSNSIQGSDPLLTGAPGRLWVGDGRVRLELQSGNGDAEVVFNRGSFWAYDPAMNIVYRGKLPASATSAAHPRTGAAKKADSIPTIAQIQTDLKHLAARLDVSGAHPTDVGGQAAYRVSVSPKTNGGLVGALKLAWDATRGVPLDFAIYAKGDSSPVLELSATGVSYGKVPVSYFNIKPPSGAKVVNLALPKLSSGKTAKTTGKHHAKQISGLTAVVKHVSFKLAAPATLAGRARNSVSLIGGAKDHGALLVYGKGLSAVVVIERPGSAGSALSSAGSSHSGPGLSIPTVQINGVTAQQLPTPLGTVLQFKRHSVSYVVLGSVAANVADAAAREL